MPPHTVQPLTERTFLPENTLRILTEACLRAGLDPRGARLLRHQTNAVYELASEPVVVKISRPGADRAHIERTLALVQWLQRLTFPTVELIDEIPQPIHIAGCLATFWTYLPQQPTRPVGGAQLGQLIRELHGLPAPPFTLPALDAVGAIRQSIAASPILTPAERSFLTDHATAVAARVADIHHTLPAGLIHADPQQRNALWRGDQALLCDWDSAATGPREWDLVTVEVHCRRFGHPEPEYTAFASAYGYDIRDWTGYPALRDLRELRMITTNARKSPPGTPAAGEVHRRIANLWTGRHTPLWNIL